MAAPASPLFPPALVSCLQDHFGLTSLDDRTDRLEVLIDASLACEFTVWRGRIFLTGILSENEGLEENSPVLQAALEAPPKHASLAFEPESQRLILWKELVPPWEPDSIVKSVRGFLADFDEAMRVACGWFLASRFPR